MSSIFKYNSSMNTKIKKQYDDFSETYSNNINYDAMSNELFYQQIDFSLEDKKLLDVGCGDGGDLNILKQKGVVVYGVEPSEEFINKARKQNPTGIIKEGIAEKIPFSDEMFDVVISKWALQTCENIPKALSEIGRVLKKDGIFILLSKHPWMQWMEKVRDYGHGIDYYEQKIVTSNIYEGKITLKEPSHTIGEYLNSEFFKNFEILNYEERTGFPASEKINNDIYPTFFIIKACKK